MLDAMGIRTGIDLDKLLQVRSILAEALPTDELYGFTPDSGLPKGYGPGGWGTGPRAG
jgi:hydroxymethylglutaryl-CoA lyase